jgi:hypothetical protein
MKCWQRKPHYRRREDLAPKTVLWDRSIRYLTTKKNKQQKNDEGKGENKMTFSRPTGFKHSYARQAKNTGTPPFSDWLMMAVLGATSERAFSIIDISCFGYTYPSLWIRRENRHPYRLWCHIKYLAWMRNDRWRNGKPHEHAITRVFISWHVCHYYQPLLTY